MKTTIFLPVTRLEVENLLQPISIIFIKTQGSDRLGYRLLHNNYSIYETPEATIHRPYEEVYFYDLMTTYRVLERRSLSRDPQTNRAIARKIVIDTFRYLAKEFSSTDYDIYLEGSAVALNIPGTIPDRKSEIENILRRLNNGYRYKESFYDPNYLINPGIDLKPEPIARSTSQSDSSFPSIPRRIAPAIPQ